MSASHWFHKKWGLNEVSNETLLEKIEHLEQKYQTLLNTVVKLEEENIETTNCLYELSNSIEAVDRRIDILAETCGIKGNV